MREENAGTSRCNDRDDEINHGTILEQLVWLLIGTLDAFLFREDFVLAEFGFVQPTFEPEGYFITGCDSWDTLLALNLTIRLAHQQPQLNLSVRPETYLRSVFGGTSCPKNRISGRGPHD